MNGQHDDAFLQNAEIDGIRKASEDGTASFSTNGWKD
jgi:hypothetical protein